ATFSNALADHPGPQAGSVGLTGVMPTPPPTTAAQITSPTNGQHFRSSPVTISGTCPDNTLIEIYKNNIFAGSSTCSKGNTFTIEIDLMFGQNVITAQVYDALNQAGPVSNPVTIFYDFILPQTDPLNQLSFGPQMLLNTNSVYRGSFPGQTL